MTWATRSAFGSSPSAHSVEHDGSGVPFISGTTMAGARSSLAERLACRKAPVTELQRVLFSQDDDRR